MEIDYSRLKRDFRTDPYKKAKGSGCIVKMEKPCKEDLEYLYIELNMRKEEISDLIGISNTSLTRIFKEYGIKKDKAKAFDLTKKTNLEKYGYETSLQNENVKERIKQTNLEKYGVENPLQDERIREKIRQTNLERYGSESHLGSNSVRERIRKTNKERYGVEIPTQNENVKEKIRQTNLTRYGFTTPVASEEIQNKIKENCLQEFGRDSFNKLKYSEEVYNILNDKEKLEQYIKEQEDKTYLSLAKGLGVNDTNFRRIVLKYGLENLIDEDWSSSFEETEICKLLNMQYKRHDKVILMGKEIDIYIPELNIGIEYNGNYWHGEYFKAKEYHQEKSLLAENNGIFIYHIFEHEWYEKREQVLNQLYNLLKLNKEKIYARKCEIREITDNALKKGFLEKNHMQGNDASTIRIGLFYNHELVSMMTFAKPRFNKHYQYELSRFCSKAGTNVIGGANKLWKYFLKTYAPESVISYSNIAHTRGNLYSLLGFELKEISEPNYVWVKGGDVKTRYKCQKQRLLNEGLQGKTEVEIMHNQGYYRVYDCGNKVWIWKP